MTNKEPSINAPKNAASCGTKKIIRHISCANCGKNITTTRTDRRFCSMECYRSFHRVSRICVTCGKTFVSRRKIFTTGKYCSKKCAHPKHFITFRCSNCGKECVIPYRSRPYKKRFCGIECTRKYGANRSFAIGETVLSDREKSLFSFHYGSRTQNMQTKRLTAITELGKRLLDGRIKKEETETILNRIEKGETYAVYK